MHVDKLLTLQRTHTEVQANSKKKALETLSGILAEGDPELGSQQIFDALLARERLGSTGLGEGIALPHARMPELKQAMGAFVRLSGSIDFDALDHAPVDLMFGLLVPEGSNNEHLEILAELAGRFSDDKLRTKLRESSSTEEIYALLSASED